MANKDVLLLCRPNWGDVACMYGHYHFGRVKADAEALGLTVIDNEKELARKIPIQEAMATHNPLIFYGNGHGNADIFTAQQREVIMTTGSGTEIMVDTISYFLSCLCALGLGYDIIEKGGKVFMGYAVSYTWVISTGGRDVPIDRYDKAYYDTSNALCQLLNRNAMTDFAKQATLEQVRRWVAWWERSTDPYASLVIKYLLMDYLGANDPLRHYGTACKRDETVESHIPVLQVIRPSYGLLDETMDTQVMLTCPSGCDLRGQKIDIVDGDGAIRAQPELTHFANGVNYSDSAYIPTPGQGRYTWKGIYPGDGQHAPQETPYTFVTTTRVTITGTISDKEGGTPSELVTVSIGAISKRTDKYGKYTHTLLALPGETLMVRAYQGFYISAAKPVIIGSDEIYVVDIALAPSFTRELTLASVPIPITFLVDRKTEVGPSTFRSVHGYHLIDAPSEIISDGKAYRFLQWDDGSTNPSRLIYISATTGLVAQYEEVGMATIHKGIRIPFTFRVVAPVDEHEVTGKMIEVFEQTSPGESRSVKVGIVCAVYGQACNLYGKRVQVLDHNEVVVGEGMLGAWVPEHGCYVSGLISVTVPIDEGEYAWDGNFPTQ